MANLVKLTGPNNRVVQWNQASSIQWIGYFKRKTTREQVAVHAFEYSEGEFTIVGLEGTYSTLQDVTDKVLSTY